MNLITLKKSVEIFERALGSGLAIGGADHDIIYGPDTDMIPPDSDNGKALLELGWHVEHGESWAHFV